MAFFPDLSRYVYSAGDAAGLAELNAGWLLPGHPFPTGKPSEKHLDLLWSFCKVHVCQTRGFEVCHFCTAGYSPVYQRGDEYQMLGSAEIRLFHPDGIAFAAPNLIYHYVADHHYAAPEVFLDALDGGPQPCSEEHLRLLGTLGREWMQAAAFDAEEAGRLAKGFGQRVFAHGGLE